MTITSHHITQKIWQFQWSDLSSKAHHDNQPKSMTEHWPHLKTRWTWTSDLLESSSVKLSPCWGSWAWRSRGCWSRWRRLLTPWDSPCLRFNSYFHMLPISEGKTKSSRPLTIKQLFKLGLAPLPPLRAMPVRTSFFCRMSSLEKHLSGLSADCSLPSPHPVTDPSGKAEEVIVKSMSSLHGMEHA